jgi:hypothetical protein
MRFIISSIVLIAFDATKIRRIKRALCRFSTCEAIFFLCRYHLLRQQDVAKWMPTKEKGRLARKNSLVENRLKGPYRLDAIRPCDANFQFSMTFNFTIFLCFSNIRNHLSNFSYLACISCKIFIR